MANEVENLYFKKGSISNKNNLINGDVGFALYYENREIEGGESQQVPVAGTIYLKDSNELVPILPKSDIQGKVLCSQGEDKPAKYLSNIILGHTLKIQGENPNEFSIDTEDGSINLISEKGESVLLQANNIFYTVNKAVQNVYLPFSTNTNYSNSYLIWSPIVIENSDPVAGSPNWPIYINNEGMVVECDSILGTADKPFDEIHNKTIILYDNNGAGCLSVADGLSLEDYTYDCYAYLQAGGLQGASTNFQFDIHNGYTEIRYDKMDEPCSIALYPAGSGSSNALELKGNICLSSDYSYSYDHPSEVVVNADDPYEGQIYFKLLN